MDVENEGESIMGVQINHETSRYPYCIVWTPIPLLTWLFPFLGHMGIGTSSGVIRDFAGPYYVSEDNMAFGKPTKYWQLDPKKAQHPWDTAIACAADVYKKRMHNLMCDNCHSMVAMALNNMNYDCSTSWNMVKLAFFMLIYGKYISVGAAFRTIIPFVLIVTALCILFSI